MSRVLTSVSMIMSGMVPSGLTSRRPCLSKVAEQTTTFLDFLRASRTMSMSETAMKTDKQMMTKHMTPMAMTSTLLRRRPVSRLISLAP